MKPRGTHTAQPSGSRHIRPRCVLALARKESYQIVRDPSSLIIAFVLPPVFKSIDEIARECKLHFFEVLGDRAGPLMPGVRCFLDQLAQRGIPCCIATSSGREFVDRVFGPHGLLDRFQFVLTCEDVTRGKPFPDVYELAASRFGIAAHQMIVFEDSPNGLQAAQAAGATCIVVPHSQTPRHLIDKADLIVPSLDSPQLHRALGWDDP